MCKKILNRQFIKMLEWPVHTWKYVQHPNLSIIKTTVDTNVSH